MKTNHRLGGILASIAALMGIIGHFVLFLNWYEKGMAAPAAEPGCEILLNYIHPILANFGILAGVLFAVSAYGFFKEKTWAFFLSVIAIVLALLGSWFVNVPYMAAGLPPVYFILFWPYVLLYFLFMVSVGKRSWNQTIFALFTGMAYIFCWMNGIASTSRIITHGSPIFSLVQHLHFAAWLAWGVVTVGILIKPVEWVWVLAVSAALTELVVGIPLAIVTAQQLGRFSLFSLAPISSVLLLIVLFWPNLWGRLTGAEA